MQRLLENKVTLITGAGRGIGRAIAERFAADGAIVYINNLVAKIIKTKCFNELYWNSGTNVDQRIEKIMLERLGTS